MSNLKEHTASNASQKPKREAFNFSLVVDFIVLERFLLCIFCNTSGIIR